MASFIAADLKTLHEESQKKLSHLQHNYDNYYRQAEKKSEEPVIPALELFRSLDGDECEYEHDHGHPTTAQCAVHLELLEAFHTLRVRILQSKELDTTFGITVRRRTVYRRKYDYRRRRYVRTAVQLRDDTFPTRRREKWVFFLDIAVARFRRWMESVNAVVAVMSQDAAGPSDVMGLYLPPLDVLMVWHAFLLNPRDFKLYCDENDLHAIRELAFPWAEVHKAINPSNWSYNLPERTERWLRNAAGLEPDLLAYLLSVRKTGSRHDVAAVLTRYGSCTTSPIITLGKIPDGDDNNPDDNLPSQETSFLKTLQAAEQQRIANKDLVDNVQRQVSFVDKMHAHLWIRSPAVEGTLRRAIDRYDSFLQLFRLYPSKMLVPALDIDLVWHTHQCSAAQYETAMMERTGRFINHDDKLGENVLSGSLEKTKELFRIRFGQMYVVCNCWDCEAILSAVEDEMDALRENEDKDEDEKDGHSEDSNRISLLVDKVRKDVEFYRAVELARRRGESLPIREGS